MEITKDNPETGEFFDVQDIRHTCKDHDPADRGRGKRSKGEHECMCACGLTPTTAKTKTWTE